MTARPILLWPDRRLATAAAPVGAVDDAVRAIWDDMIDTMEALPGVGLAAPQIGVMRQLAVVDASEARGQVLRMADPECLEVSEETHARDEASPCLPGLSAPVTRPVRARIGWTDETGARVDRWLDGLWARSALHQIDHLAGRLFVDRLSRTRRDMLLRKARRRA